MAQNVNEYLLERYKEAASGGAFYGIDKFYRSVKNNGKYKVSKKQVQNFLMNYEPYTLHRGVKRKFPKRKIITPYAGYQVDVDSAYMMDHVDKNDGYGYFIAAIDCFSKLAFTAAVKSLKAVEVSKVLETLLLKFPFKIERCRTDIGSEYKSHLTQKMFKKLKIKHFFAYNTETKSSIAERFFRSFKAILYRYMTANNTHRWVDALENLTTTYNNTYHRTIKRPPATVTKADEHTLWKLVYEKSGKTIPPAKFTFELNDTVRLSTVKGKFDREFHQKWTREYFLISERLIKQGIAVYRVKDLHNEPVTGTFYASELQKIIVNEDEDKYIIEKIVKRKGNKCLVRWLGWGKKFDTWLHKESLQNYVSNA